MNRGRIALSGDRSAGLAGIVYVALAVVGSSVPGLPPAFDAPIERQVAFYAESRTALLVGGWLTALALPLLLVFLVVVRDALRCVGEGRGGLANLFQTGFAVAVAVGFVGVAVTTLPAFAYVRLGQTSDATVRLAVDLSSLIFAFHAPLVALSLTAFTLAVRRAQSLPSWLAWLALVVVAMEVLGSLSVFAMPLLNSLILLTFLPEFIWILATGVALIRGRGIPTSST